jgi:hypothetical protein
MSDLKVEVNGEQIYLRPNASISFVFNNSLLDTDNILGSFAIPFQIPATPRNRRIFKFMELIESPVDLDTEYSCVIYYGILTLRGIMKVRPVSPGEYQANVYTDIAAFADFFKNKKINELELFNRLFTPPDEEFPEFVDETINKKWPETNYVFLPIRNPKALVPAESYKPVDPYINYYRGSYRYNGLFAGNVKIQLFSPQVCLGYLLDEIFKQAGSFFENTIFEDSPECFDRIVIYSNNLLNKFGGVAGTLQRGYDASHIYLADHLPAMATGQFLNAIRQFLFLGFVFDFSKNSFRLVRLKDVINAPYQKDWSKKASVSYSKNQENPKGFTLDYSYDSNDLFAKERTGDFNKNAVKPSVANIPALPVDESEVDYIRYVVNEAAYYICSRDETDAIVWNLYRTLFPVKSGDAKTLRKPELSVLISEELTDETAAASAVEREWKVPSINQEMKREKGFLYDGTFPLRLLFNWGLQGDWQGGTYPYGSESNGDIFDNELGTLALRYHGDFGIVNKLGKEWLSFLQNTRKISRQIVVNDLDINNLKWDDTIRVDGVDYLWKSFKISLPITKPAEFELWKK